MVQDVRNACSAALGELIAAQKSNVLQEVIDKEPRENKKQTLQKLVARKFQDALSVTFCEAALSNKKVNNFISMSLNQVC